MSSTAPKSSFAATLGLILVLITSAFLLIGMGVFSVQLLVGILVPPPEQEQPSVPPVVPPGTPGVPTTPAPVDPAVTALLAAGKETFQLCAACHGSEGKAIVPNMAPNLAGSAYVNGPSERLSMLVLNGIQYPGTYLGQMISWKASLTDDQIAGVLTYVRASFGNSAPPITAAMIKGARDKHGPRNTPYSRAELDQVVADLK
jgi:mono/diheme cytochrome c family protein